MWQLVPNLFLRQIISGPSLSQGKLVVYIRQVYPGSYICPSDTLERATDVPIPMVGFPTPCIVSGEHISLCSSALSFSISTVAPRSYSYPLFPNYCSHTPLVQLTSFIGALMFMFVALIFNVVPVPWVGLGTQNSRMTFRLEYPPSVPCSSLCVCW